MSHEVELVGGPRDGHRFVVSDDVVRRGVLVVPEVRPVSLADYDSLDVDEGPYAGLAAWEVRYRLDGAARSGALRFVREG